MRRAKVGRFGTRAAGRALGATLAFLVLAGSAAVPAAAEDADDSERLMVNAFVGEVINNFSSSARKTYVNPEDVDSEIDRFAGLGFWYQVAESEEQRHSFWLFGEAIHSSRVLEVPCKEDDPDCDPIAIPEPDEDFFKIVRDSSTLEWYGGAEWSWGFNWRKSNSDGEETEVANDDDEANTCEGEYETAFYVKAEAGFIRAKEAQDDVVDNHFLGVGIEHEVGRFRGSYLELGIGRTDLYPEQDRSNRGKLRAGLIYTPQRPKIENGQVVPGKKEPSSMGFFMEGALDSDFGPGSDDVQIHIGLTFDIDQLFKRLSGDKS